MYKKIAMYGGSFDPPHIGHLMVIKEALKTLDIDLLVVVPTYLSRFKDGFVATPEIRAGWMKRVVAELSEVVVDEYEITCQRSVASIETVRYLREKYSPEKMYLVIGADNLTGLPFWNGYEELISLSEVVVASRQGYGIDGKYERLDVDAPVSSTELKKSLNKELLPPMLADEIIKLYENAGS